MSCQTLPVCAEAGDMGSAIAALEAFARDSAVTAVRMAGNDALRLAGRVPTGAEFDAIIEDGLRTLHDAYHAVLRRSGLTPPQAVDVWLAQDMGRSPAVRVEINPMPYAAASVGRLDDGEEHLAWLLRADPWFHQALAAADAQARVSAVARAAASAAGVARSAPERSTALWGWLTERVERLTDARFLVRLDAVSPTAALGNPWGQPLALWTTHLPWSLAAE